MIKLKSGLGKKANGMLSTPESDMCRIQSNISVTKTLSNLDLSNAVSAN